MNIESIEKYKIDENVVLSETDKKHIENYKQIIKFLESSLKESLNNENGNANYLTLHSAFIQGIHFLNKLVSSYDESINSARTVNNTIDKIINDNTPENNAGN